MSGRKMTDDDEAFYQKHRGGGGPVIVVTIINNETGHERHGVFGSIEAAHAWRKAINETECITAVYAPYVVDDPEWGNRVTQ